MTIKGRGPGKMPLRAHPARGPLVATPSVQDFGRKKREKSKGKKGKKEKNFIAPKSGLVGMKRCLKFHNRMKYFLAYLSCF